MSSSYSIHVSSVLYALMSYKLCIQSWVSFIIKHGHIGIATSFSIVCPFLLHNIQNQWFIYLSTEDPKYMAVSSPFELMFMFSSNIKGRNRVIVKMVSLQQKTGLCTTPFSYCLLAGNQTLSQPKLDMPGIRLQHLIGHNTC